jgi:hypothetical protein
MKPKGIEMNILEDTDRINAILAGMVDDGMIEPIDDPNLEIDFWDWADVVGIVEDFAPLDDPFWGLEN